MEASLVSVEIRPTTLELLETPAVELDIETQRTELDRIYKEWLDNYSPQKSPKLIKSYILETLNGGQDQTNLLKEISGFIALSCDDIESDTPFNCFSFIEQEVIRRLPDLDTSKSARKIEEDILDVIGESRNVFAEEQAKPRSEQLIGSIALRAEPNSDIPQDNIPNEFLDLIDEEDKTDRESEVDEFSEDETHEIPEIEGESKPSNRRSLKRLNFSFEVDGLRFRKYYSGGSFVNKDLDIRLLLALGQAPSQVESDEQWREYINRMANKGTREGEEQFTPDQITEQLKTLAELGLVSNGGPRYRLTRESLKVLIDDAARDKKSGKAYVSEVPTQIDTATDETSPQITRPDIVGDQYPPLPSNRNAEDFYVGQQIIVFMEGSLHRATIKKAEAYSTNVTLGPDYELDQEVKEKLEQAVFERVDEIEQDERENSEKFGPDYELLRRKVRLVPLLTQIELNPSPGFIHLVYKEGDPGLITDMNHNYIITIEAWSYLINDPSYLEAWLQSGSEESQRDSAKLRQAIKNASISRVD